MCRRNEDADLQLASRIKVVTSVSMWLIAVITMFFVCYWVPEGLVSCARWVSTEAKYLPKEAK